MDSKIKLIIIVVMSFGVVRGSEPQCACSKFYYEEKLLEKMVRTEFTVENMKKDIDGTKDSVEKTMEEFYHLKSALENTVQQMLKKSEDIRPAFTARLSERIYKLGTNQPIVFDNIVTNIGQAYSETTGVFTAPHNGTYYFTATVMSLSGQQLQTEVVLNGVSMVKMHSYDKAYEQGTNGVVLNLNMSDDVWVRKLYGENVNGYNWSSFSGFQI